MPDALASESRRALTIPAACHNTGADARTGSFWQRFRIVRMESLEPFPVAQVELFNDMKVGEEEIASMAKTGDGGKYSRRRGSQTVREAGVRGQRSREPDGARGLYAGCASLHQRARGRLSSWYRQSESWSGGSCRRASASSSNRASFRHLCPSSVPRALRHPAPRTPHPAGLPKAGALACGETTAAGPA